MTFILIISIVIIFVVILVTALITAKAYKFKHTIDPLPTDKQEQQNKKADSKEIRDSFFTLMKPLAVILLWNALTNNSLISWHLLNHVA